MTQSFPGRILLLVALLLSFLVSGASPAAAQDTDSAAALRRENDQLRERISQLEARVRSLERENESLKLEAQRLRDAATPARPGTTPVPTGVPTTVDVEAPQSQEPLASTDALLAALQASYEEQFGGRPLDDDAKGDRIQEVRRWTRDAARSFRGNIDWVIRIDKENLPSTTSEPIPFWVINPENGMLRSVKPMKAVIPSRFAARILESPDITLWDLRGSLTAEPVVNADRPERGMLDFPPFIGPYAEFAYDLSIRSVTPQDQQN